MDWAGNYQRIPNMEIIRYQPNYHRAMMAKEAVPHRLNCEVTAQTILREAPDLVVVATGAEFVVPQVEGLREALERGFAVTLDKAMSRETTFDAGRSPVIYGAGLGGELAIDYTMRGLSVRLVDPLPKFTPANFLGSRGPRVEGLLAANEVRTEFGWTLERLYRSSIEVSQDGTRKTIDCDRLIIAIGRRPANALVQPLREHGLEVQIIGDAKAPRSYGNAIHEAAYLSRRI
jgi:2-enoate reductase